MKKLLGISLFAVLAATPLMASAADTAPVAIPEAKSGLAANGTNVVTATKGKYYAGETITDADKAAAASAAYVKGAYNAAISAVNKVAVTADSAVSTANNAANKNLTNLTATGKANVSAQGTYDASTNYTAGTVGAAIKGKADSATTLAGYGITDAYTKTEADGKFLTEHQDITGKANTDLDNLSTTGKANVSAQGTYNASATYQTGTVGKAIQDKADKATTLAGYGITNAYTKTEADGKFLTEHQDITGKANTNLDNLTDTGKANVSAQGTYNASTNYTAGTVGAAIKAKADKSTTLAGYGITNAYTKTETDNAFATKTGVKATVDAATGSVNNVSLAVSGSAPMFINWGDASADGDLALASGSATGNITGIDISVDSYHAN